MAKKKSYYRKILSSIRKDYPDLSYNDAQKYASDINELMQTFPDPKEFEGNIGDLIRRHVVSRETGSFKRTIKR